MKILTPGTDGQTVSQQPIPPESSSVSINSQNLSEFVNKLPKKEQREQTVLEKAVVSAFNEADDEERKENAKAEAEAKARAEAASTVNVKEYSVGDGLLALASGTAGAAEKATVTKQNKDDFCSCLVSNSRYTEKFSLFSGKLVFTLRSRTLEETDSIEAYLRWMAVTGGVYTAADYSNLARNILLAAQVQEMNGVSYPELKGPMRMTEVDGKREPPGWLPQLETWGKMADAVALAITRCLVEFEARYWFMVENAKDANFWLHGESTVE